METFHPCDESDSLGDLEGYEEFAVEQIAMLNVAYVVIDGINWLLM